MGSSTSSLSIDWKTEFELQSLNDASEARSVTAPMLSVFFEEKFSIVVGGERC